MFVPWMESYAKPRQCIKKQRHQFADKGAYIQSCDLSSCHVWMWELDHKEGWVLKNWCFWTVVLNGAGEDYWESFGQQGDQTSQSWRKLTLNIRWKDWCWSWSSNTLATWSKDLTHWKRPWCWERLKVEEKGVTEDGMVGWHRQLDGHGFE